MYIYHSVQFFKNKMCLVKLSFSACTVAKVPSWTLVQVIQFVFLLLLFW